MCSSDVSWELRRRKSFVSGVLPLLLPFFGPHTLGYVSTVCAIYECSMLFA